MNPTIEIIAQTVVFLFSTGSPPAPIGTAFCVGYPHPHETGKFIPFIVTARHVIGENDKVLARYSRSDSETTAFVQYDFTEMKSTGDYFPHPDQGVDIAVFRTPVWKELRLTPVPLELIATKDVVAEESIGITDRVIFPSLLVNFIGSGRNYPVMRSGSIALAPTEKVPMEYVVGTKKIVTQQEILLLNAVSMPGASGAPVFLDPGPRSNKESYQLGTKPFLLGVMHGFYPAVPRDLTVVQTTDARVMFSENSGIAVVFPAWRIREILDSPALKARVEQLIEQQKEAATNAPLQPTAVPANQ